MDLFWGEWVPSAVVVVSMLLLASVHLCLTKSDMHLGLAALRELGAAKVPSQHELDRQERFEAELLKVRIDIFERLRRVGIHVVFAINLIMMQQLLVNPSLSSAMALLGPLLEYGLHTVLQAGFVKIQAWSHFRIMQSLLVGSYAVWTYGVVSQETDLHAITAMEKLAAAGLVVQSVAFIDWKVPIPTYILGAAAVTLKQWQIGGPVTPMMILSSVVSHVLLAGMMFCLVYVIQCHIGARLESDDASSLLLASRAVLRGVCDGDLVLDRRSHCIVEDSTTLERLLNIKRKLSGSSFLDLFLDAGGRQQFLQFLQSEAALKKNKADIPPCLRIILQGAHGLVSTDVFCTSCAVAGRDYYLLAFRADPDQFGIPPDAHGSHGPHGPWRFDQQRQVQPRQPSESTDEVVKAIRQLVQLRFLVDIDTPRLDIEEATLSFSRSQGSRHRDGMPTLRSFVCVNDWQRVKDLFRSAKESLAAEHGEHTEKVWRFPSSLLFRIPGRPGNYFRARSAVVSVGDGDEETEGPPEFVEFHLGSFDLKHLRKPREQDLESIGEDEE